MEYDPDEWDLNELRETIESIDKGVKKLHQSGISHKVLMLLIQHAAPTVHGNNSMRNLRVQEIEAVLVGLDKLKEFVYGEEENSCR